MGNYYVYILTNRSNGTFYIGVTNNLQRRIMEHRVGAIDGFTKKYELNKLVCFQEFDSADAAIYFEKRLKRWRREWKMNLIERMNPTWCDLYEKYFVEMDPGLNPG